MFDNLLLLTDSYKVSHSNQYPSGTEYVYSYLESRGGEFPETVFFGLQYLLKKYLSKPITQANIDEAEAFFKAHFGNEKIFNKAGWQYILEKHNGYLPVSIKAIPEGTVVPTHNVLMTIENTDPNCWWLTNYLETLLLQVWYPTTVSTLSREFKKEILQSLEKTGDPSLISFKLHDFGFRGVSSVESAGLGASAHLVNFLGTDTVAGLILAREYYKEEMAGFSIPAAEHSTITSWGREHEKDAYKNMLQRFPDGLVAVVSDSYNIFNACENIWGKDLHDYVMNRNGTLIVRPDSGEPNIVVVKVLEALGTAFGTTRNGKGYKLLPPQVRVIQGDGVDLKELRRILYNMTINGWSTDNVAFGSGGALLQKLNRDTQKFAIKCSSVTVNGVERDVYKQPVGDKSKASKRGRMKLTYDNSWADKKISPYSTVPLNAPGNDLLREVFRNGEVLVEDSLSVIRERAKV